MIAYSRTYLENSALLKKAKYWLAKNLLTKEQFNGIEEKYKVGFYSPNLFIKIGLFIFTYVLISAAVSMFSVFFLMMDNNMGEGFGGFTSILFCIACFVVLEVLIKNNNLHRSGIDEALLYAGLGFAIAALCFIFNDAMDNDNIFLFFCILFLPLFLAAVARYADTLIALISALCAYSIYFQIILKFGDVAKMIMPFALMALSALIYFQARKYRTRENLVYWKHCITAFECVALIVFYVACNYFVIRESSIEFFNMNLAEGEDIPLAFVFYILTALVPIGYVYYGLKRKDKTLLWIGLVLIAAAALTFKYYFSLGHPEVTLTLAGSVMILIAYLSIKYLKTPKHGISFEEEHDEDSFLKTNAEALVIAQTFHQQGPTQPSNDPNLGGGDFGGGGAGSKF